MTKLIRQIYVNHPQTQGEGEPVILPLASQGIVEWDGEGGLVILPLTSQGVVERDRGWGTCHTSLDVSKHSRGGSSFCKSRVKETEHTISIK